MTATSRHRVPVDRRAARRHLSWPTAAAEVIRSDDGRPLGLVVPTAHPLFARLAKMFAAPSARRGEVAPLLLAEEIDRIEQARWFLKDCYLDTDGKGEGELSDGVWQLYVSWVVDQTEVPADAVMLRGQFFEALASLGYRERCFDKAPNRLPGLIHKSDVLRGRGGE